MQDMQNSWMDFGLCKQGRGVLPLRLFVERSFIVHSLFSRRIRRQMACKRQEELKHLRKVASDSNSGRGQSVHVFVLGLIIQRNQPECISNSVMKIDEIFPVDHQEVSTVEIEVSFLKDIPEFFLLCLRFPSSIAIERCKLCDFANQEPDLT